MENTERNNISDSPQSMSTFHFTIDNIKRGKKRKQVKHACIHCKKAHACCSETRPCKRCWNLGLQDSCVDAETVKKRGRKKKDPVSHEQKNVSNNTTDKSVNLNNLPWEKFYANFLKSQNLFPTTISTQKVNITSEDNKNVTLSQTTTKLQPVKPESPPKLPCTILQKPTPIIPNVCHPTFSPVPSLHSFSPVQPTNQGIKWVIVRRLNMRRGGEKIRCPKDIPSLLIEGGKALKIQAVKVREHLSEANINDIEAIKNDSIVYLTTAEEEEREFKTCCS